MPKSPQDRSAWSLAVACATLLALGLGPSEAAAAPSAVPSSPAAELTLIPAGAGFTFLRANHSAPSSVRAETAARPGLVKTPAPWKVRQAAATARREARVKAARRRTADARGRAAATSRPAAETPPTRRTSWSRNPVPDARDAGSATTYRSTWSRDPAEATVPIGGGSRLAWSYGLLASVAAGFGFMFWKLAHPAAVTATRRPAR